MEEQILTVYKVEVPGTGDKNKVELYEVFSRCLIARAWPEQIDNIIAKRGYTVVPQPYDRH